MWDLFKSFIFLKPLTGKRTQLLVALTLVANAYGFLSNGVEGFGVDLAKFDPKLVVQELMIATVGTVAAKFDRIFRK